ncbi:MAG: diguanylate cyclase [Desulfovibrio sp.]
MMMCSKKTEERECAILCIDDESMVTEAIKSLLRMKFKDVSVVEIAQDADEALEVINELKEDGVDLEVVLTDYIMPGMKGDELLVKIHEQLPDTKKIMLTGQSNLDGVKRAINEADLYRFMEKPWNNDDLILTLKGAIESYRQSKVLKEQNKALQDLNKDLEEKVEQRTRELEFKNKELKRLSTIDHLTGLYNRFQMDKYLEEEFDRVHRHGADLGVILLDIDRFKAVNDKYGHQKGDEVLKSMAKVLKENSRKTDRVGRWGGEEFLVICSEADEKNTLKVAEKLRLAIGEHCFEDVRDITASFGVAAYEAGDTPTCLVAKADTALYRAKENGRNRVELGCKVDECTE